MNLLRASRILRNFAALSIKVTLLASSQKAKTAARDADGVSIALNRTVRRSLAAFSTSIKTHHGLVKS